VSRFDREKQIKETIRNSKASAAKASEDGDDDRAMINEAVADVLAKRWKPGPNGTLQPL
jgi:hypothetical protein